MAQTYNSPGVDTQEKDFTVITPQTGTSTAGVVAAMNWGPVLQQTQVTVESDIVKLFGKPSDTNFADWFSCSNFLAYSPSLKIVRVVDQLNALNATVGNAVTGFMIAPVNITKSTSISGGSLTAGTYYYKVTALNANGETLGSVEVSQVTTGTTSTNTINWTARGGAIGYRVYRGTTAGTENVYFTVGNVLTFADVGDAGTVGTVPTTNTASVTTGGAGQLILNKSHFQAVTATTVQTNYFVAKYPGVQGNSLQVSIADNATFSTWQYRNLFDTAPDSSGPLAGTVADAMDEIHLVVVDKQGLFTGTPGAVLEVFPYLSKAADGRNSLGNISYYISYVNANSSYIWAIAPIDGAAVDVPGSTMTPIGGRLTTGKPFVEFTVAYTKSFVLGNDGDLPSQSEYIAGYDIFKNADTNNVGLLITAAGGGDSNHSLVTDYVANIATSRQDCVAFISPKISSVVGVLSNDTAVTNIIGDLPATAKTSYVVMTTSVKLQYDYYNDVYRWIPGNADDAGLCAQTENLSDVWMSPAGYNRGVYKNCISLAFSPDKASRDVLYKTNINPVVTFDGTGTILYGDKTLQPKKSAFSQIGVRRLFIALRGWTADVAKYTLFEFNDPFTQSQFVSRIDPRFRDAKGRNGISDYKIICNSTNNTADVIMSGGFMVEIKIKPQYSTQNITLTYSAVGRNAKFNESVG